MRIRFYGVVAILLLPALALAVPLRRVAPAPVEHRLAFRHKPVAGTRPAIAFVDRLTPDGHVFHKLHGPETVELLLGTEIKGDFVAEIEIDIAGFRELGIRANGGSPMPYFGFRSSDGQKENYFHLDTLGGGWHSFFITIQRKAGKITAQRNNFDQTAHGPECSEPGYVLFVMNDTAKCRIRRFQVR